MAITTAQIKELREMTGIGMMECKKALEATDGNMEKAVEELRKKGLAKAAKKADRETTEWAIKIDIDGDKAYIISVACETDFLANSDKFKAMLDKMIEFLKENGADSKENAQEYLNQNYALEMGENLQIKTYEIKEAPVCASYVHSNAKIAALVLAKEGTDEEKARQVAMHITASNPEYLSVDDISDDVVNKEKEIQLAQMKNDPKMSNKSDDVLLKIIEGKMGKFKSEISLLEQAFVMDGNLKVSDFIGNDSIIAFERYSV